MKEVDLIPDDPKSAECVKQLEQVHFWSPLFIYLFFFVNSHGSCSYL